MWLVAILLASVERDRSVALAAYNKQQAAWYNCLDGVRMRAYFTAEIYIDFECAYPQKQRPVGGIGRRVDANRLGEK